MEQYSTAPRIFKDTSCGTVPMRLEEELLENRQIVLLGEINSSLVNDVILQMMYLAKTDPGKEITLLMNSPGGEVNCGLALYDVMNAVPCPIRTVCMGLCASMAAVIFAAGDRREMLRHSRVMIHDPAVSQLSGRALDMNEAVKGLMDVRVQIAELLAQSTGRSPEEILELTCRDTYFTSAAAVEFGLADSIIERIGGDFYE